MKNSLSSNGTFNTEIDIATKDKVRQLSQTSGFKMGKLVSILLEFGMIEFAKKYPDLTKGNEQ